MPYILFIFPFSRAFHTVEHRARFLDNGLGDPLLHGEELNSTSESSKVGTRNSIFSIS